MRVGYPRIVIEVSAVCLFDERGRVLTVRKHGTIGWMHVGGKPELGETPIQCLLREVREELMIDLNPAMVEQLDTFHSTAVNEQVPLTAHVFVSHEREDQHIHAEIAALQWVDPADPGENQAPLNTDLVFPLLLCAAG